MIVCAAPSVVRGLAKSFEDADNIDAIHPLKIHWTLWFARLTAKIHFSFPASGGLRRAFDIGILVVVCD